MVIIAGGDSLADRRLLVVHVRFIASSDGGKALRGVLGEYFVERSPVARMLAQVQLVLLVGNASLLAVPFVEVVRGVVALHQHYPGPHARTLGAGADFVDFDILENPRHGYAASVCLSSSKSAAAAFVI